MLERPWELDHVGGSICYDGGKPCQVRTLICVPERSDGRGGKVKEPEPQLLARTVSEGALADAWRSQEEDERA